MESTRNSPPFDQRVSRFDLGGSDAESDGRLADHFVTTPYVMAALAGRRRIFLGRKGSGKSALWNSLPRLFNEGALVVLLGPANYSPEVLKEYAEAEVSAEYAHSNAWRYALTLEVAGALLERPGPWGPKAAESADRLKRIFSDLSPAAVVSWIRRVRELNVEFLGFGVGFANDSPGSKNRAHLLTQEIIGLIGPMLREQDVVVAIDRLDDTWDDSDSSKSVMIGLLKAAKDLNDRFAPASGEPGLRVLTFLRSEIYGYLEFDDKDKHRVLEETIEWTPSLLTEMVNKRLPSDRTTENLFQQGRMSGSNSPFSYIIKRTFLRPREVLQFLDQCIRSAREGSIISRADVREAEETYSQWKVDDLKQEYRKVHKDFGRLLDSMRGAPSTFESQIEFREYLASKGRIGSLSAADAVNLLFELSVIGVRKDGRGPVKFRAEDHYLLFPLSGSVHLHPSLYKGLGLL